jgi:hypothetical protein
MARDVDEAANFVFVKLIEQEQVYMTNATQTMLGRIKIDLAWERISHES